MIRIVQGQQSPYLNPNTVITHQSQDTAIHISACAHGKNRTCIGLFTATQYTQTA